MTATASEKRRKKQGKRRAKQRQQAKTERRVEAAQEARRKEVQRRVEEALGDRVICFECYAKLDTYGDKCKAVGADLGRMCEGFRTVESVRGPAARAVYRL